MKRWLELVMAWFVGGFLGRLFAVVITDFFGLSAVWAWLGVPIGAGIAWMAIDFRQLVFSFRHSSKWTKLEFITSLGKSLDSFVEERKCEWRDFKKDSWWNFVSCLSFSLLVLSWLIPVILFGLFASEAVSDFGQKVGAIFASGIVAATSGFIVFCLAGEQILEVVNRFLGSEDLTPQAKEDAYNVIRFALVLNPFSAALSVAFFVLWAMPVWYLKASWKTIQMVNSSQRMTAMTGAAIGLTLSQIFGYNPIICGGVCVLVGLAERVVFGLVVQLASRFQAGKVVP